jgi:TonB-linked SusC/RagA family outer membrane protein
MKKKSNNYLKRLMLYFAIVLGMAMPSAILAQETINAKGTVLDTDGLPIIGVTVVVQGTTTGTITGIDGNFSITVPKGSTLEFSFIGFERQSIQIDNASHLNIVLKSDVVALEDVVVVGFGTQRKESVVGAIGQITSESLESIPVTNISHAIAGQTAGITVFQSTGELGNESSTIRIRGVGTYVGGSQQPLFVIDGLIRDEAAFNALDVYDVSGINILKDASATAVYGVRGANGVIIVTTHRGRGELLAPKVTATANFGVGSPTTLPKMVDSYHWAVLMNEAIVNDGIILENHRMYFTPDELWKFRNNRDYTPDEVAAMNHLTEDQKQQLLNSPAIYYGNTDYMKEMFNKQLAPHQKYNVNLRGGSKDISYYSSVGYSNQGTYINDHGFDINTTNVKYEKFNARTNLDIHSIRNTTIRTSMSAFVHNGDQLGGIDEADNARYKGLLHTLYTMAPWFGPGVYDNKIVTTFENPPPDMLRRQPSWALSPIAWNLMKHTTQTTTTNIDLSIRGEHRFDYLLKGLKVNGTLSFDQNVWEVTDRNDRLPAYNISRNPENPNEILWTGGEHYTQIITERERGKGWGKNRRFYVDAGISYANTFGQHNVTAMSLLTAERFAAQNLLYNIPRGIYGLVGRATYDYATKYLFEFNIGYNGSENFAEDRRFGAFPSIAAGWVASNEDFFPETSILTWLKLRGSYGQVGNSNIGGNRFLYMPGQWGGTNELGRGYYFGDADGKSGANPVIQGIFENSVGNPFVTWETKTAYNIGLETRFFNDKLSITPEYFNEKRDDILSRIQTTPVLIGLDNSSLPFYNVGKVSNKGYEIEASWSERIKRDISYNLSGHFSYSKNTIDYMAETMQEYDWMNTTGFSVGQFKGFKSDGLYNTEEELVNRPKHSFLNDRVQLGDIRYVDINGDGIIDDRDRVPIGYSNLPQLNYGFSTRLNYKGWGFYMQFTGSARGTFDMTANLRNPFRDYNPTSPLQYMTERWTQERYDNGEKISFPRLSTEPTNTPNEQNSDYWIRSTDFLKLKNLELSYNFERGVRLYVNANNVHTWIFGDLPDYVDPEQANSRNGMVNQGWIYPLARVYNIGLSVKL